MGAEKDRMRKKEAGQEHMERQRGEGREDREGKREGESEKERK